jgi:hypothetical protein
MPSKGVTMLIALMFFSFFQKVCQNKEDKIWPWFSASISAQSAITKFTILYQPSHFSNAK